MKSLLALAMILSAQSTFASPDSGVTTVVMPNGYAYVSHGGNTTIRLEGESALQLFNVLKNEPNAKSTRKGEFQQGNTKCAMVDQTRAICVIE